jgi:hypothetical protein
VHPLQHRRRETFRWLPQFWARGSLLSAGATIFAVVLPVIGWRVAGPNVAACDTFILLFASISVAWAGDCLELAAGTIGAFCLLVIWRLADPNGAACVTLTLPFPFTWTWRRLQILHSVHSGLEVPASSGACFLHRVMGGGWVEEIEDVGRCGRPRAQRTERHWLCCIRSLWLLGRQLDASSKQDIKFDARVRESVCGSRYGYVVGCGEHEREHQ